MIRRRDFLQQLGALGAASLLPRAARGADAPHRKLLFVFCAWGGAGIIDSFLPLVDYETDPLTAAGLNVFPSWLVEQLPGSAFRSVRLLNDYAYFSKPTQAMSTLVRNHGQDMAVITHDVSSVNHTLGQQRSLDGAGVDGGRTIAESVATVHGKGLPLPSVTMAIDGFVRHGTDPSVPPEARHELVMAPTWFAAGTHGYRGIASAAAGPSIERARKLRDRLESESVFAQTFRNDARRGAFLRARREVSTRLEQANLLDKLLLLDPSRVDPKLGLAPDPLTQRVRAALPSLDHDPLEAQVALGFLMALHGASSCVSMGCSTEPVIMPDGRIVSPPIAFDFAHNSHRVAQSLMWSRTAQLVDALITLLKTHDYMGDPAQGKMWDRSLVYIATEFGRDKQKPALADSWSSGHHLNNGSVMLSPLLKGNAVYGGVDPNTGLTYGFDPQTGKPDKQRTMTEADVYGIIAQAFGVPVPEGRSYPGVVR